MPTLGERIKKSWNVFFGYEDDEGARPIYPVVYGSSYRPDRPKLTRGNDRSIVNSIYNRISVDAAQVDIRHIKTDENGRYKEDAESYLNEVLSLDANIDQTGRAFIQDVVMSLLDEGCVALVPTVTSENPDETGSYDIYSMRTGRIVEWFPKNVRVSVYNDKTGKKQEIVLEKSTIAIVENPFYSVMNEPNSTLQRLIRILNTIDKTNERNAAGKMDLIIQLPYLARSEKRKNDAENRRKMLEEQLTGSQYGIGYIDGSEHIVQLNRSIENNLWQQAQDLKVDVYNQLGLTEKIFDGTANEEEKTNYYSRTIEPILTAICEEMTRKFLTPTARTKGYTIRFFRNPFKLVGVDTVADYADKFSRNEILSSNEIRDILGYKPVDDGKSDELRNANMPQNDEGTTPVQGEENSEEGEEANMQSSSEESEEIQNEPQIGNSELNSIMEKLKNSYNKFMEA